MGTADHALARRVLKNARGPTVLKHLGLKGKEMLKEWSWLEAAWQHLCRPVAC